MGMNQGGRIVLLASAVVLLIIGVVCLKQQLGHQEIPPAFVPGDVHPGPALDGHITHQPTILPADPSSDPGSSMHHSWPEPDLLPAENVPPAEVQTYPVGNGNSPSEQFAPWDESKSTQLEAPFGDQPEAEPQQPPPPLPETLPHAVVPNVVVTKPDDSLWTISEQVYGEGIYYRALFALNKERIPRPDRIEGGIELQAPAVDELRQLYPELCPPSRSQFGSPIGL